MRLLTPLIFLIIAAGVFFGFIDPTYERIRALLGEQAQFNQALDRSRELQQARDRLRSQYITIPPEDVERLEKMLPDNIDNVRLILDIDSLSTRYGMRPRNVQLQESDERIVRGEVGEGDAGYNSIILSFSVTGSYDTFRSFLEDLERSLRLVDVVGIEFSSTDDELYDYSVSLKTYWLKI